MTERSDLDLTSCDQTVHHHERPEGAIHLTELCRYLSAIARRRQFWHLDNADVDQYTLLLIFKIIGWGEGHSNHTSFWERLSLGATERDVYLVPDTKEGCRYQVDHPNRIVLVRGVKDIRAFFRRAFVNQVISDFRADKKQQDIRTEILGKSAPTRFRRTVTNELSLDAFANDLEAHRRRTDLECALEVIRKMYKSMKRPYDPIVYELFLQQYKPLEIAMITEMSEAEVRKSILRCKRKFQSLWKRIEMS